MMQSFIFSPGIVSDMNEVDQRNHRQLTPRSLYTCIRAVIKLINKQHAGVILGVEISITNMNTSPNVGVVDFLLNEPPILFPLPPAQSNLPHDIVLYNTGIPETNLHIRMNERLRSGYFTEKCIQYPFRCILLAARLFPQKILGAQVLKTRSRSCVAMVIINYRTNEVTLTKSFFSPIFDAFSSAKLDACSASYAYIINNCMAKLELLDNNALQLDS